MMSSVREKHCLCGTTCCVYESDFFCLTFCYNFRGLIACIAVFSLFGVTQISDGPFKRPHPGMYRQNNVNQM